MTDEQAPAAPPEELDHAHLLEEPASEELQAEAEDAEEYDLGREQSLLNTISLLLIASVAVTTMLIYTRSVMVPFVLAVLTSYLVSPIVDLLQVKLRVPRPLAMLSALLLIASGLAVLVLLLTTSIGGLTDNISVYRDRVISITEWASSLLHRFDVDLGQDKLVEGIKNLPLMTWVRNAAGGLFSFLSTTFLIMIFSIYLVIGRQPMEEREGLWAEIDLKIRRYIATKVSTSAVTGILVGLILWAFGLDLALVFGMMAFLLNFIPSIGSLIATLLPLPFALLQFDNPWSIALVVILPGIVQNVIGNAIEPKLMGDSLDLHPVTILLALIFWGLVWGLVGMLLAAPITAVLKIVLDRFETTRPAAGLLAGRLPKL